MYTIKPNLTLNPQVRAAFAADAASQAQAYNECINRCSNSSPDLRRFTLNVNIKDLERISA